MCAKYRASPHSELYIRFYLKKYTPSLYFYHSGICRTITVLQTQLETSVTSFELVYKLKCQLVSLCMTNHSSDLWNLTESNKAIENHFFLPRTPTDVIEGLFMQ